MATKTGLLAFEGDTGIVGETATFNGTALTDAINGPGNLMNSTMAVDGVLFAAKNPNYGNLMGTDIDVWNSTGPLGNHQSTATLAFASNQDLFVPSALWLVSDEGPAANTAGPTVGGVARDGSTLTANPGTWDGTPTITYEYQWQRCDAAGANCVDIPGETGSTYTLTPADVGSTIRVLVTAVNDAGSSAPSASAPSATSPSSPRPTSRSRSSADPPGRPDADDHDRQLERHGAAGLRRPVAALRRARRELRRHRRRDRLELRPGRRRRRRTVRSEVTATNDAGDAAAVLRADDHGRPRPAGQHRRCRPSPARCATARR